MAGRVTGRIRLLPEFRPMMRRLLSPLKLSASQVPGVARNRVPPDTREPQNQAKPPSQCFESGVADLAAVLHRLSQPLTALRGSLELALLTEGSAADYELALKESLAQADNLVRLFRSLWELVEAQDAVGSDAPIRLDKLVEEAGRELRVLAESRGSSLVLDSTQEVEVRASLKWLRRALYKVLHQAIERSPRGGAVLISVARADRYACLRVTDQGPGVPAGDLDQLSRISSLGKLFSEAAKRDRLEWAIAKRIFEAQGGAVCVENPIGGACCFTVRLPLNV